MHKQQRYDAIKRANLLSALVNLIQALMKVIAGWLGNSPALLADGIHSFSDLLANLLVWFASKIGRADPDHNHPYGHGRFETFGSFTLGLFLLFLGLILTYEAVVRILHHTFMVPHLITLMIAVLSVIMNEAVFHYGLRIATRVQSSLLRANAYHNRADSLSSLIVIIGILASLAHIPYADSIATILVAGFIFKIAVGLIWQAAYELTDAGVSETEAQAFAEVILSLSGVKQMHRLRTRKMGDRIFLDVHILIAPYASASEGHYIAETVHYALKQKFPNIADMIIHVDTEDHPETLPERLLPNRRQIEAVLFPALTKELPDAEVLLDLFYYREYMEAQVTLPLNGLQINTAQQWQLLISEILKPIAEIKHVTMLFN